jgi:hypothetical protein
MRSHSKKRAFGLRHGMRVNNPMTEQLCTETDEVSILGGQRSLGPFPSWREFCCAGITFGTRLYTGHFGYARFEV